MKIFKTVLTYLLGIVFWVFVMFFLQKNCIVNVPFLVNDFFMKNVGEDISINLIGDYALRVSGTGCDDAYIYTVKYHPSRLDIEGEPRSLDSMLDISSWEKGESESISVDYSDKKYKYFLYVTSDGAYVRAIDK